MAQIIITEDYVSLKTARLLKEKGFDVNCITKYRPDDSIGYWSVEGLNAPTLQMAMKWLRQKYNLHIITLPYAPMDRHPYHPGEADMVYIAQLFRGIIPIDEIGRSVIKLTPEEACDAAIKYCLENLI